jgi:hypothetical protein
MQGPIIVERGGRRKQEQQPAASLKAGLARLAPFIASPVLR